MWKPMSSFLSCVMKFALKMSVISKPAITSTSKVLICSVHFFLFSQNSDFGNKSLSMPLKSSDLVRNLTSQDLEKFEDVLAEISNQRVAASKAEWNLYNSIFFCMTVTTTIGKLVKDNNTHLYNILSS